jgi:hypothetical protein
MWRSIKLHCTEIKWLSFERNMGIYFRRLYSFSALLTKTTENLSRRLAIFRNLLVWFACLYWQYI